MKKLSVSNELLAVMLAAVLAVAGWTARELLALEVRVTAIETKLIIITPPGNALVKMP